MSDYITAAGIVISAVGVVAAGCSFMLSGRGFSCPSHLGVRLPWGAVPAMYLNRRAAPLFFEMWLKYRAAVRRSIVGVSMSAVLFTWWIADSPKPLGLAWSLTLFTTWNAVGDAVSMAILQRSSDEKAALRSARKEFDLAVKAIR